MKEQKQIIFDGISDYIEMNRIKLASTFNPALPTYTMKYPKTPSESYKKPIATLKKSDILDMIKDGIHYRDYPELDGLTVDDIAKKIFAKYTK